MEGVWHTGIVVYGQEYYYGGGISVDPPAATPFGKLTKFNKCLIGSPTKRTSLGFTEINKELFTEFLLDIRSRFTMDNYHVFNNNCNNFTHECA